MLPIVQFARDWIARSVQGRVLFTGPINGRLAAPNHAAYDTSKGAVEMMVKTLCVSLAPKGIRVNGMAPGLVRTPLTEAFLSDPKAMAGRSCTRPTAPYQIRRSAARRPRSCSATPPGTFTDRCCSSTAA